MHGSLLEGIFLLLLLHVVVIYPIYPNNFLDLSYIYNNSQWLREENDFNVVQYSMDTIAADLLMANKLYV